MPAPLRQGRVFALCFAALLLLSAPRARAEGAPPAERLRAAFAALAPDEPVLVRFAPAPGTRIFVAHRAKVAAARLRAQLEDAFFFRQAIPSFVKAAVTLRRARAPHGPIDRRVDWELEVPAWNLAGRLWLKPFGDGVQLRLAAGDFAPGSLFLRALPDGPARSILTIEGTFEPAHAPWAIRKLAHRHPLARPAMVTAALVTLVRALALTAAGLPRASAASPRWPQHEPAAPATAALRPEPMLALAAALGTKAPLGLVHTEAGGRMSHVQIAWRRSGAAHALLDVLAKPWPYRALPGWGEIATSATRRGRAGSAVRWVVRGQLPFVDFSTTWDVSRGQTLRAHASTGAIRGAVWGWDVLDAETPNFLPADLSIAIYSLSPRLDRAGWVPRRFIEREPLLEHGLSMALGYVNAFAAFSALDLSQADDPRIDPG